MCRWAERLPAFTVELTDGSTFDSSASGGSVTFIMFFDTTCPDCRATLPRVQQVYEAYRDRGVRFALISVPRGRPTWRPIGHKEA